MRWGGQSLKGIAGYEAEKGIELVFPDSAGALIANALIMLQVKQAHDQAVAAQEHSRQAIALINEMRLESEQLAHLVRAYTVTGEARYLLYYYDIIAIQKRREIGSAGL